MRSPFLLAAMLCAMSGCNGLPSGDTGSVTTKPGPQKYIAPAVRGGNGTTQVLQSYLIDDTATGMSFQQISYSISEGGAQIKNSGTFTVLDRGLRELTTTYTNPTGVAGGAPDPAKTGLGWAVELANQAGGLVQLFEQPFTPLAATSDCPTNSTATTYQFVTIPDPLLPSSSATQTAFLTFNPAVETGYGSVSISANGDAVTLSNIAQHTLPGVIGSTGAPASPSPTSITGLCSSTLYGYTTSVPGQVVITNPGNGENVPASATIGIGPTGLLVEDDGELNNVTYQNSLGAGTGAIGLPQPTSALDTGAAVGAQYLGFIYGSGLGAMAGNWSSAIASFGFSSVPASCAAVAPPTATMIYGGDFTNNDPSAAAVQAAGGFGSCDYAIDLGVQDSSNNGLYPAATIWIGASFTGNKTGASYSFPAVAVAGQLGGKYAIFLLGVDTTGVPNQAQGIYLLQSN